MAHSMKAELLEPASARLNNLDKPIQPKLKVGKPGDKYEQQADRMADAVMRMPDYPVQMQAMDEEEEQLQMQPMEEEEELQMQPIEEEEEEIQMTKDSSLLQKKCERCKREEKREKELRKKSNGESKGPDNYTVPDHIASQLKVSQNHGSPLDSVTQKEMSYKMGRDFSDVQIHDNAQSVQISKELGAKAFTYGSNIYFNRSEYNPQSSAGKRLLAHELTHVMQQTGGAKSGAVLQREIEGTFRVEWRNKIDSEIKDRGNAYAVAVIGGISAASMPGRYDDTVKTFLDELQTELGKYALGKVLENVPGGGAVNAFVTAMVSARDKIEAENIQEAYAAFKAKTRDVLLAGVDSMTDSEGQFSQRVQDLIIQEANQDPRFSEPPSETEDADQYSREMQSFIQRKVNHHMFGNESANFSHLIADVNDFIERSFQYFILARAEVLAEYRKCMSREATEGSACDQGFWSWEQFPRECRHERCKQWLTYSPMPPEWSGPRPRQEHIGMCGGQMCSWFTVSTGVEHPAGHASVEEGRYRRERARYRRQ